MRKTFLLPVCPYWVYAQQIKSGCYNANKGSDPVQIKQDKNFQDKLLLYSKETSKAGCRNIEAELWNKYGTEQVVFVLDMSGFSLLTRKYGIIHYLSMVRRMQLTTEPIIKTYGGYLLKFEADNCFAVFPDTLSAVHAAIALQLAFNDLEAERVVAETHPENPASNRVLEKLGFECLGERHHQYDDLPGFDTQVLWALTRQHWREKIQERSITRR